jgi:prolyl oligopeptidase
MVVVSRDGRYAVALERLRNPIPVAIATLGNNPMRWRPFVTSIDGTLAGHVVGDHYIAITDIGAPRGRLVAIPLEAEYPNDPSTWQELLAESNATLRTVTLVGDALYLTELVETYARVRIVDLNGKDLGEVPLPTCGAVSEMPFPLMNLSPKGHPERFLFGFSSLTVSQGIYSYARGESRIEAVSEPQVRLENTVVEDRWAVSADGTRIPYHIVRRRDLSSTWPQPTLIYAYGGFNYPLVPQFPGPMAAFVAAGGMFVHAHLRGGAEFGREWWEGGRLGNKQKCYDDLFAVTEDLIAHQRSTPQLLAVTGSSNGGLMAGVAVTQRPDLWRVVVPRVPSLDLVGACREPYGRMCTMMEYANVEDPAEVRRLATFSPYHLVRDGVSYPAVFLDAGDTDPRCPPWHARKFAARLQRATSGSAPILLHVWENAGHGWATDTNTALAEYAEWLAFTLRHLGVELLPGE